MRDTPNLLPLLYATDSTYGWSRGMRAISHALLAELPPVQRALEIGCGAGRFLREYAMRHPDCQVVGLDLNPMALGYAQAQGTAPARPSTPEFLCGNLLHLPFADNSFGLVTAFDVYDQSDVDLVAALAESHRVLVADGLLLLRVSAYRWLESAHDRAFNTGQRYNRGPLIQTLQGADFCPFRVTYANMLLALPVIALRLAQKWGGLPYDPTVYAAPLHNWLMARCLQCEAAWLAHSDLPFGISLYVLARKQAQ